MFGGSHIYRQIRPEYRNTGTHKYTNTLIQEYENTGTPWDTLIQEYTNTGTQEYKNTLIQEYRNTLIH